ncbi:MAG: helix-turn-helix domain-containing protein [Bacteroidota bacterium]
MSAEELAKHLGIRIHQLAEILNVYMGLLIQDSLNQYRKKKSIKFLYQEQYMDYSILGIATEAGFSSKSSFNAMFNN